METAVLENNSDYDRKWFGFSVSIPHGETTIDIEDFKALNKNCVNFQQLTNPPENGGEPAVRVLDVLPSGDEIRVNGSGLGNEGDETLFTAPRVLLRGNDRTEVTVEQLRKLKKDERFRSLVQEGEIRLIGNEYNFEI